MKTIIYMVRHGESPYNEGNERTRGLTPKGKIDIKSLQQNKEQLPRPDLLLVLFNYCSALA
ncbi:MAG: histidine phosphatase family protein [Paenibacillus sp.]|nr:histidine phosphatase family protein [Paenibacillus sp.]